MFEGKPIIGIAGGIGSGKSFVAKLFGELGCLVISSDDQVRDAYREPRVLQTLREWWGPDVVTAAGEVDRKAIARRIFEDSAERQRLENLLHPLVNAARDRVMQEHAKDAQVLAFIWDTPLLIEVGWHRQCDALVFVDTPRELRLQRLRQARGWTEAELDSREKSQMPLDKKREISDYVISNTAGADEVRDQVREVLSRILAGMIPKTRLR